MENFKLLKSLGFTEYEARVYLALCDLGPCTAKEISDYSNLPRNKTYEMLRKLESKNRIQSLPVSPAKFKILDINQLKDIISEKKKELLKIESNVNRLIEESSKPKSKDFKEIFWIIRGKKAIINKMKEQNLKTKNELLSINRLSVANPINLKNMKIAIKKETKVLMLVPNIKKNIRNVKKWQAIGVDIREYDEKRFGAIGTRISVFDKKTVRITFGEPDVSRDEDYITLWAESPYLANIMRNYFYGIWKRSKKI
jgi:sugar-specific transcriptional regulator TrmB